MKALLVTLVFSMAALAAGQERAQMIHIYSQHKDGSIHPVGKTYAEGDRNEGRDYALVCRDSDGYCSTFNDRTGISFCNNCHASVDRNAYTATSQTRHLSSYFLTAQIVVSEGQRVSMGELAVTRVGGQLAFEDSSRRVARLPFGALLVKGRTGSPAFVVFPGSTVPAFTAVPGQPPR